MAEQLRFARTEHGMVLVRAAGVSESVTLPAEAEGTPVVAVGDGAFAGARELVSVTLPDSITHIGAEAFRGCKRLRKVAFGAGFTSIGKYAFRTCVSLADVSFPSALTDFGEGAFRDCAALTAVHIPAGVAAVPADCFRGCSRLARLTFAAAPQTIGERAFCGCALTEVVLPDGVREVADDAFGEMPTLTAVHLPETLTSVLLAMFAVRGEAEELAVAVHVTSLAWFLRTYIRGTSRLWRLFVAGEELCEVTLSPELAFPDAAFCGCISPLRVKTEGIAKLPALAFAASGVVSFVGDAHLADLGVMSFLHAKSLTELDIPAHTAIGFRSLWGTPVYSAFAEREEQPKAIE